MSRSGSGREASAGRPDSPASTRGTSDRREEVLRYLARLSSEVTSGQLDPASVNWRYIRDRVLGALAPH